MVKKIDREAGEKASKFTRHFVAQVCFNPLTDLIKTMFENGLMPNNEFVIEQEVIDGIHKSISAMVQYQGSSDLTIKDRGQTYTSYVFREERRNAGTISEFATEMITFCYSIFELNNRGKSYSSTLARLMEFGEPIFPQSE